MSPAHGIHRQLASRPHETRHSHGAYLPRNGIPSPSSEDPERAQRLAMRYDILKERLTALHCAPHKNMEAIDGVIALLARTQCNLMALHAAPARAAAFPAAAPP